MLLFWYRYWSGGIVLAALCLLCLAANLPAGTVRPGFAETVIAGSASGNRDEAVLTSRNPIIENIDFPRKPANLAPLL